MNQDQIDSMIRTGAKIGGTLLAVLAGLNVLPPSEIATLSSQLPDVAAALVALVGAGFTVWGIVKSNGVHAQTGAIASSTGGQPPAGVGHDGFTRPGLMAGIAAFGLAALLGTVALLQGCATNPATGNQELLLPGNHTIQITPAVVNGEAKAAAFAVQNGVPFLLAKHPEYRADLEAAHAALAVAIENGTVDPTTLQGLLAKSQSPGSTALEDSGINAAISCYMIVYPYAVGAIPDQGAVANAVTVLTAANNELGVVLGVTAPAVTSPQQRFDLFNDAGFKPRFY